MTKNKERASEHEHEPTVYVVDDDLDMRDSLQWLMRTVGLQVEVYPSASAFLEAFKPGGAGCLVFDVRMPGTSGLDLYEELVARGEGMPVIFMTAFADVPMAIRAMKSGAIEFVEKPFNRQALLDRVQRAIKNEVERLHLKADREAAQRRFRLLTDKEREVLALIKDGQPNKAISATLGITPRAVEMRRAGLMKKLEARNFAELLRLSIEAEAAVDA
ncbi:two component transcriptional regulator, LuxR family [Singulisphaera sp. GP187]|uniref:response regulator transcription factor n=1 Tax=Singulisphaera sp. GP187 TaxID=1882752 RepID=UPI00092AA866|nr:response regulator [Singulisphaera sp. GP187]SIO24734.1 two component transcriptional regulator, LuxR family [Singulisphaera sp. GP187]